MRVFPTICGPCAGAVEETLRWLISGVKAYAAAAAVFALDRLTKWIVETRVSLVESYRVIPGFFDIVHSQNRGVAFGLFNDSANRVANRRSWWCFRCRRWFC